MTSPYDQRKQGSKRVLLALAKRYQQTKALPKKLPVRKK